MKVLYDISVLGQSYTSLINRTGIFRVIENIAYQLSLSKECELLFCAGHSFEYLNESLKYLESDSEKFKNVPIACTNLTKLRSFFLENQKYVHNKIIKEGNVSRYDNKIIFPKILRRLLSYINNAIVKFPNELIHPDILDNADIFHSTYYPIPEQVKKTKNKSIFLTVYDLIPVLYPQFFEWNKDHILKKTLSGLDEKSWVICISDSTKNDLCNYRKDIDPSRVFVTHLAASDFFYPCNDSQKKLSVQKKYNIPDSPYILSLCTLEPRKNLDHTIRCFACLLKQEHIKDLYLVLAGTTGWDYKKVFEEFSNYPFLKDRIIFTGYLDDEDLAPIYSGAIAFVYPSFYEGFGLPPLEAMKCGVSVITSNTSSLPEVVGDAGIMVSPTDEDALCQAMLEIYKNSSLRKIMSLKSIERAKLFSWEKCTLETINAYKTALNNRYE
jgi:glycosyltransferase involved in cell wall biosynthesis